MKIYYADLLRTGLDTSAVPDTLVTGDILGWFIQSHALICLKIVYWEESAPDYTVPTIPESLHYDGNLYVVKLFSAAEVQTSQTPVTPKFTDPANPVTPSYS